VNEHTKSISRILTMLAEYYDKILSKSQLTMYSAHLQDLTTEELQAACSTYTRDPNNKFFPLPAMLRQLIRPVLIGDDENAREAAGRILASVSKFGHTNTERAREYVGDLGWAVVARQGGWLNVCTMLTEDNVGMLQAQWRELAISLQRRARAGLLDTPPGLPEPAGVKQQGLEQFNPMALLPSKTEGQEG